MDITSDNPEHGFQFPGTFELSAMGAADKDLDSVRRGLKVWSQKSRFTGLHRE